MVDTKVCYYEKTKYKIENEFVKNCIDKIDNNGKSAMDLGCGTGGDSLYLLKKNYRVRAIDSDARSYQYILQRIEHDKTLRRSNLVYENIAMEELSINKNTIDCFVAYNSLSFCKRNYFDKLWNQIVDSIVVGGFFVGNFFGEEHQFNMEGSKRTFFTKESVERLFEKRFQILEFLDEPMQMRQTASGYVKWKEYAIFAVKRRA